MEATNIHPGTLDQIYKIASVNLSPNTTGQARMHPACTPHTFCSCSVDNV